MMFVISGVLLKPSFLGRISTVDRSKHENPGPINSLPFMRAICIANYFGFGTPIVKGTKYYTRMTKFDF
jgi:hypothetical protein